VYRALSASALGAEARPMALKVLHGALAQDTAEADAFLMRMKVHERLTRLDHPGIVACHGVEVIGGRPVATLELVDAVSLDRLFPERGKPRFSLEAATNLLLAVMDALAAAANDKVVHGRLTPGDVLVHADGSVMVTGFGKDGPARADFLALHRLAQSLGAPWLPEVDAWLDSLAAETPPWKDMRAARLAFPLAYTDAGQKALDRAVKNRRKKDQKLIEEQVQVEAPPDKPAKADKPEPKKRRTRTREEAEAALRQARVVSWSALFIVLVGLAIEVLGLA
jgi:serine/threonine protein kinase